jgi:hypothetical protein
VTCSFCGGTGGWSECKVALPLSPRGPKGPRESSRDSSLVACAPTRRIGVLGPRPDDLMPELADADSEALVDLDCDSRDY